MKELDKKKFKLEILKVTTAKAELEYKIEERLEDIQRLKDQIIIQDARVAEIEKLLAQDA